MVLPSLTSIIVALLLLNLTIYQDDQKSMNNQNKEVVLDLVKLNLDLDLSPIKIPEDQNNNSLKDQDSHFNLPNLFLPLQRHDHHLPLHLVGQHQGQHNLLFLDLLKHPLADQLQQHLADQLQQHLADRLPLHDALNHLGVVALSTISK